MDAINISDIKEFSSSKYVKKSIFESANMLATAYFFELGQSQDVHKHARSDKVVYVVEGEGVFKIGKDQFRMTAGTVAVVPAGIEHSLTNIGKEKLVVLQVVAPREH